MVSNSFFALGIGIRAALIGALAFAVVALAGTGRFYATALVVAGVGALIVVDLARHIAKGDRMFAAFVGGLAAGDFGRPTQKAMGGFRHFAAAMKRTADSLTVARASSQRRIERLQTLLDTTSVVMITVDREGHALPANRAAHRFMGDATNQPANLVARSEMQSFGDASARSEAKPIGIANALGDASVRKLLDLPAGQRAVVRTANGQRAVATVAQFAAAGASDRLLSLQNIESELDAVELKAWQDLVRTLAHEMMNSLTPISSLAESVRPLLDDMQSPRAQDVRAAIDAIARRSVGLVSFVERYRKLADFPQPTLRPIRIADFIERIERLLSATLDSRRIRFSISVVPADLAISADPDLLEQLLINLIHNAADATSQAEAPSIEVRGASFDGGVSISVADNGCGIAANQADTIFVPFFTTKPGGSGIGLSLARQIARAHQGRLEVAGNQPQGAVFTLSLPQN